MGHGRRSQLLVPAEPDATLERYYKPHFDCNIAESTEPKVLARHTVAATVRITFATHIVHLASEPTFPPRYELPRSKTSHSSLATAAVERQDRSNTQVFRMMHSPWPQNRTD